ncbi:MAG: HD domain-containing protein [Patescibacteria group bacterium]|nr:HD domain-containing protein [Patescibacteria group bacterium]
MEEKFEKIKQEVEKELSCSAHNMDHIMRVYNLSLYLAKDEDVDLDVLKASVLLHDIARVKEDDDSSGKIDHAILGAEMAVPILRELDFTEEKTKHIQDCIVSHRYHGRTDNKPKTKEAEILFDADKLDVVGAIGIARGFFWHGRNNKNVNIFEINIKLTIDRLYTEKAKEIAKERIEFHKNFLDRMRKEENREL